MIIMHCLSPAMCRGFIQVLSRWRRFYEISCWARFRDPTSVCSKIKFASHVLIHCNWIVQTCMWYGWSECHDCLVAWYHVLQRHRDRIAHLTRTLRSILPPSERQEMTSVLAGAIKHIRHITAENEVRALHGCHATQPTYSPCARSTEWWFI